ncbi:4'-phosphopantetheinyl transferase superfamily protein [Paenibacillus sp. D2_2]|uniref:4'-phosphopantetheinyl transferase family protein n=1 Tax=Paenibacillus sp. D2_2 TaxID=3073092 RepID=UPI0028165770|nr:4'-phosphopantetheinyl transferase superfamily protein [Paenibacillus sp. D2_2]WMT41459.1 4'-phosphopantetheinyl transferase superfamily protein [Paenibacillus sp. D2_2]
MLEIYMTPLHPNMNTTHVENLLGRLPEQRQARIRKFTHQEDAHRSLVAEALSRWLICDQLGIVNHDLQIVRNSYGKPLVQGLSNLYFNNSHSGQWVVCAISDAPIGVDIEKISDIDLQIAEHFFSEQELLDLNNQQPEARASYFFELWTLKESYIKAEGQGLSLPLSSFTIRKQENHIGLYTDIHFKSCFFKQYSLDCLYKMAVCAQTPNFPEQPLIIEFPELYQRFMSVATT